MNLINANELIEAGIRFSIVDTEVSFDDNGELIGYNTITNDEYHAPSVETEEDAQFRGFYEADYCGDAIEDFALLDDGGPQVEHMHSPVCDGDRAGCEHGCCCRDLSKAAGPARWEHMRDSHIEETFQQELMSTSSPADKLRDFGEMSYHQIARFRRCCELVRYVRRLALQLHLARSKQNRVAMNMCHRLLAKVRRVVAERYRASVKLIVHRGRDEWWMLYLKRDQRDYLLRLIDSAR